ncbi:MAG: hypothetical protein KBT31_03910, partial [Firmicutes bacterium]|nr:hypothetical protein [Candidatus Colimorpha enterica]
MKKTIKRILMFALAAVMLINAVGCSSGVKEELPELEPSASVVNEISWLDIDPIILIKGDNIVFDAGIGGDDIQFFGAFRNLYMTRVTPVDNSTLLISTSGNIYSDDACGSIQISKESNSTGEILSLEVSIERSNFGRDLRTGGFWTDLGLDLLKGIATTGAEKAFGYGLDKLLYDKLGINIVTLKTVQMAVEELGRKIDALSNQINQMESRLTDVINESTKEILTNDYLNTFEHVNALITSIKSDTLALWKDIATVQSTADETSEEYRTLIIAEMLTFSEIEGKSVSPLVSNVAEAISYIDGSYFSMNPESLYSRFLKIGCTRSVFVGEAAILVSEYLNSLNSIIGEALNVMTIVCQAKYFTHRQLNVTADKPEYKDVINYSDGETVETKELIVNLEELAKTDGDLKNRLPSSAVAKYKDKANGSIWQSYLKQIISDTSRVFDAKNADSVVSSYNTFVQNYCNCYNKSYTVSGNYVTVNFVNLRQSVSSTGSAECGVSVSGWTDSDYKSKLAEANKTINYYLTQCMTANELDTFYKRLMSNESGLLFRNLTEAKTYTLTDVLKMYGFSIPGAGNLPTYFATGSKLGSDSSQLILSGFPTTATVSVDKYGKITSSFADAEDLLVFKDNRTLDNRCYFYYFTEEVLISTADELVDYVDHIVNDRPYVSGKLMADIDLSGIDWATVWPTSKADVEFRGTFNGNSHTISNFTYNEGSNGGYRFGLFRRIGQDAVVRNLTFDNVSINCENSDNVGVCVGEIASAATVTNIKIMSGSVKGASNVGGLVGASLYPNTVSNSVNYADISGKNNVGGIFGYHDSGKQTFTSCTNFGKITASAGAAGGIVALMDGNVSFKNTVNEGEVRGYKNAGGLIGSANYTLTVTNSENKGVVTSETANAGGFVGSLNSKTAFSISGGKNSGIITGSNAAGGFVGYYKNPHMIINSSVENSQNSGTVTADNYAGGFFGYASC